MTTKNGKVIKDPLKTIKIKPTLGLKNKVGGQRRMLKDKKSEVSWF